MKPNTIANNPFCVFFISRQIGRNKERASIGRSVRHRQAAGRDASENDSHEELATTRHGVLPGWDYISTNVSVNMFATMAPYHSPALYSFALPGQKAY